MEDLSFKVLLYARHQSHADAFMPLMVLSNPNIQEFEHLNCCHRVSTPLCVSWLILLLKTLNSTGRCTTFHILVWSTTARTQLKLSAKIHCKVKNAAYSALKVINRYCKQTRSFKLFLKIKITLLLPSSPLLIFPFSSAHQELHGFFYNYPGF